MFEIFKSTEEVKESSCPIVAGQFEDEEICLFNEINEDINKLVNSKAIKLTLGTVNKFYPISKMKTDVIYLVGLGKKSEYSLEKLRKALCNVNYKLGNELLIYTKSFKGDFECNDVVREIILTIGYANYKYDECKSEKTDNKLLLKIACKCDVNETIKEAYNLVAAINNTRDLVNKPYNYLSAVDLANYAKDLVASFEDDRVSLSIYNKQEIENLKMNAFLGVNKGSTCEPRLIYIKYQGKEVWENPVALIGKGLMYDTGGYSLKQSMNTMKCDMTGSATVLGTLEALVRNNVKANVIIVICATDNRINGEALLPDDVLTAMNGKTIEIISTDAEGRLTLADAVCFAQKEGSKEIIDIATLTGACVVALGDFITGVFGNNQEMVDKFIDGSKKVFEDTWQLPINEQIRAKVRSSQVADFTNSTGRPAGASGAAAFIEGFIEKDTKWVHLDIAGTAFHTSPTLGEYYGATGVMVKSMYQYFK